MLVDINLLPKKKKSTQLIFTASFINGLNLTSLGTGGFIYWLQVQDVQALDSQIYEQRSINQNLQHELEGGEEVNQAKVIQTLSEQLYTDTAGIVSDIHQQIPNKGELIALKLNENQIDLTITTTTNEQAVQFYKKLEEMDFYEVVIHTINYDQSQNYFTTNYTIHLEASEEGGNGS